MSSRGNLHLFQFTRAGERATAPPSPPSATASFQFTRAGERATCRRMCSCAVWMFQFTRAGERATRRPRRVLVRQDVSIHARWGARDSPTPSPAGKRNCFNSRALGSARLSRWAWTRKGASFQFTRAGERATGPEMRREKDTLVSIHARWGARDARSLRPPRLGRVSIHARWGARDRMRRSGGGRRRVSIHARWGARDLEDVIALQMGVFQFTRAGERATGRRAGGSAS